MSKHVNINFKYLVFSVDLIVVKHNVLCCNARREVCYHFFFIVVLVFSIPLCERRGILI